MRSKLLRRATAMLLCAAMLLCTPAMAASDEGEVPEEAPTQGSDIPAWSGTPDTGADTPTETVETPPGGEGSVEAQAMSGGVEPFSVTLPTSLSVTIGADGSHVSQAAWIDNTGAATIKVTDVSCTPASGWMLRDYDNMDPNVLPLGEHSVGFRIRQAGCPSYSKTLDTMDVTFQYYEDSFAEIPHGNFADLEYDVCIPAQSRAMTVNLMDVTFVVSAYHSYTLKVTAQNGSFDSNSVYQPIDQTSYTDIFTVSCFDHGIPIVLSVEEQNEIQWYRGEKYSGTEPINWQQIGTGQGTSLDIIVYGWYNHHIRVCWNGAETIFIFQTRGQ